MLREYSASVVGRARLTWTHLELAMYFRVLAVSPFPPTSKAPYVSSSARRNHQPPISMSTFATLEALSSPSFANTVVARTWLVLLGSPESAAAVWWREVLVLCTPCPHAKILLPSLHALIIRRADERCFATLAIDRRGTCASLLVRTSNGDARATTLFGGMVSLGVVRGDIPRAPRRGGESGHLPHSTASRHATTLLDSFFSFF